MDFGFLELQRKERRGNERERERGRSGKKLNFACPYKVRRTTIA